MTGQQSLTNTEILIPTYYLTEKQCKKFPNHLTYIISQQGGCWVCFPKSILLEVVGVVLWGQIQAVGTPTTYWCPPLEEEFTSGVLKQMPSFAQWRWSCLFLVLERLPPLGLHGMWDCNRVISFWDKGGVFSKDQDHFEFERSSQWHLTLILGWWLIMLTQWAICILKIIIQRKFPTLSLHKSFQWRAILSIKWICWFVLSWGCFKLSLIFLFEWQNYLAKRPVCYYEFQRQLNLQILFCWLI